jgi:hypothetical protein
MLRLLLELTWLLSSLFSSPVISVQRSFLILTFCLSQRRAIVFPRIEPRTHSLRFLQAWTPSTPQTLIQYFMPTERSGQM